MPEVPQPADLSSWMREIEQRLRAIETAPKMQNTSVTDGTTTVLDATGAIKTQFGLLNDGTYGIGVLNADGTLVSLGSYVFGFQYSQFDGLFNTSSTTYTLVTSGPSVTFTAPASGKALISGGAYIGLNATGQTGAYGFRINGVDTALCQLSNQTSLIAADVNNSYLLTGLTPGTSYTAAAVAKVSTSNVNFSSNWLSVQPY